ncbi:MAG: NUDIX hydrolase, partial [Halobacteriaceae archaeon]
GAVIRSGEYLLIERAPEEEHAGGTLAFPGGKVEASPGVDDPIESTARRELAEEVGIDVGSVKYVRSRTFETDTGEQCINVVTLCEYQGGKAHPRSPDEVSAVHWLSADEIRSRESVPDFLKLDVERMEMFRQSPME